MDWLHGILNLIGLLFWVSWRAGTMPRPRLANSVAGPAPRQGPVFRHSWMYLLALVLLLLLRAVFYNQFGPGLDWIPSLNLLNEVPFFRSDWFPRALAYSIISFARWLVGLYFCLALLSTLQPDGKESPQWRDFLSSQFSFLGSLTPWLHWGLAASLSLGVHYGESLWMMHLNLRLETDDETLRLLALLALDLRAAVYLLMGLIGLYLLNSYVYFGERDFWKTVHSSGKRLLSPLKALPLVIGKIDLAPIIALGLAYGLSYILRHSQIAGWLQGAT